MLFELQVSNFALIEDLRLEFSPGLNILSGETGAGKSIVIGALNLLLGERAAAEHIRQGSDKALVEGFISLNPALQEEASRLLDEAGIETGKELLIAREVFSGGRSVARVNGRAVPVSFLKQLGSMLFDLHGQHQHQSLLKPERHLALLDAFSGEEAVSFKSRLTALLKKRGELKKELSALGEDSAERERRIDIYTFQLDEINAVAIAPGEDEELIQQEKVLSNAEKLCETAAAAYRDLYSGDENRPGEAVLDTLRRISASIQDAASIDKSLSDLPEILYSAATQIEDVSHTLRSYSEQMEFEPSQLAAIQERLNLVNAMKRKYGGTVEAVLEFALQTEAEIDRLKNSESLAAKLETGIAAVEKDCADLSEELHLLRLKTAAEIEKLLEESLAELALPNAVFKIAVTSKEGFSPDGADSVEFLFSANRGEEARPLAKIISGGEVSRVMLAMKSILAHLDLVPTLIFDEVDSGIGGATIQAVAEKLARLALNHQVMCVTHSPQIAAMADRHYRLFKKDDSIRTMTLAEHLEGDERKEELARMLDGASIDKVSLQHVESLVERSMKYKNTL